MSSVNIILTLVFAAGVMIIMVLPAMKIADWLSTKYTINQALDDKLTVILTIILSLIAGAILRFA